MVADGSASSPVCTTAPFVRLKSSSARRRTSAFWQEARAPALPPAVFVSSLVARRPPVQPPALGAVDRLNSGVDATEVAERAGNSGEVPLSR